MFAQVRKSATLEPRTAVTLILVVGASIVCIGLLIRFARSRAGGDGAATLAASVAANEIPAILA